METTFRLQKTCAVLFTASCVALLVLSLGFMTDFKDLFGLQLRANQPVAYLHDVVLQGYNRALFHLAVASFLAVVLSFVFEAFSRVPDRTALVVLDFVLAVLVVRALLLVGDLAGIEPAYLAADYGKVRLEGGFDYVVRTRTFTVSYVVEGVFAALGTAYGVLLAASHVRFVKTGGKA